MKTYKILTEFDDGGIYSPYFHFQFFLRERCYTRLVMKRAPLDRLADSGFHSYTKIDDAITEKRIITSIINPWLKIRENNPSARGVVFPGRLDVNRTVRVGLYECEVPSEAEYVITGNNKARDETCISNQIFILEEING